MGKSCQAVVEEGPDIAADFVGIKGLVHTRKPLIHLVAADLEWKVSGSHPWVAPLDRVQTRAARPFNEVVRKLAPRHRVIGGKHGSQCGRLGIDQVVERFDHGADCGLTANGLVR